MDEMKPGGEIENAVREIAKRRDQMLREVPALSPARQSVLSDFLAREFPVDAALRKAAAKRDESLNVHPEIPASAKSALHRQLGYAGLAREGIRATGWLKALQGPLGAALTVCVAVAAGALLFGRWETPRRTSKTLPPTPRSDGMNIASGITWDRSPVGRAELFTRRVSMRPFNLNTNEPASLQASFFANSSVQLADGIEAPLGLRLDLPVRAILMEDTLARTP